MKKILSILALLLSLSLCSRAQTHRQLDSLSYILPHFAQGSVVYADKQFSRGLLNISPIDQTVYCITADGDTLTVMNNEHIVSVSAGGRSFVRWKDAFVERILTDGDTGIGIIRSVTKVNNVKTGAYGMVDNSSSITTYARDEHSGAFTTHIIDDPKNYVYRLSPCLYKDGKYFYVNKKSFEKLFPEKKDLISSLWQEMKINVGDVGEVTAFYNEIKQQ